VGLEQIEVARLVVDEKQALGHQSSATDPARKPAGDHLATWSPDDDRP
jgi:hypothetical protein